jgi:hypothetical protein
MSGKYFIRTFEIETKNYESKLSKNSVYKCNEEFLG